MNANLRPKTDGTHWEPASAAPAKTSQDGDDGIANDIFNACLGAFFGAGKSAKEVAWELGLSESHLSEMRAGKRSVTLPRLIKMCRRSEDAWLVLGGKLAAIANSEPPRRKKRVDRAKVKQQLLLEIDRAPQVFELFVERIARSSGASEDEVRDAWSETTGVHEVTG